MLRIIIAIAAVLNPVSLGIAVEDIPLPREVEILTIAPRLVAYPVDTPDPEWLTRGGVRPSGTYENPLGSEPYKVNPRQLKLLRALDNLKFEPEDNWDNLRPKFVGPETLTVPPRVAK